ncbi:MAG: hypothetical protein JSU83_01865 [Deltaproteobacteria bacterium]|nr:MAG: hypothetical protein JSU83_01865 [Deltaproteobacteria bacterium]
MSNMPKRDITGECEGECRDRVREGEEERQAKMNQEAFEAPESFPRAPWANSRKEQPGIFGGHV